MPTGEMQKRILYCNGQPIGSITELPQFDYSVDEEAEEFANISLTDGEYSCTVHVPRMSRKRAVKLLMANGKSRNGANAIVKSWNGNYAHRILRFILTGCVIG